MPFLCVCQVVFARKCVVIFLILQTHAILSTHTQGISTYACARMNSMYAKCYYYSNKTQRFVRDSSSSGGISLCAKVSGGNGREKVRNKSSIQMPVTCVRARIRWAGANRNSGGLYVCVCGRKQVEIQQQRGGQAIKRKIGSTMQMFMRACCLFRMRMCVDM